MMWLFFLLGQVPANLLVPQGEATGARTGSLLFMVVLGLLGLAALGFLFYRKRHAQSVVEERFRSFRSQAVSLMDQLDSLRQRHKTLAADDPDFTVPMKGATLAMYNDVNRDLDALWERWLKVMDIWDEAQKRIRSGSGLGVKPTEEARALLEGGEIEDLVRRSTSCKERLDRLNQGHEHAREDLAAARSELAFIQNTITQGTGVLLPSDPHHGELSRAENALRDAEAILPADPIGAEELITRARRAVDALSDRPEQGRVWHRDGQHASPIFDELAAAAERFRASVGRFGILNLLGLFARAWVFIWVVGLLFGLLTPLLPLFIILVGFFIIMAGGFAVFRALTSWFWLGMGGPRLPGGGPLSRRG